MPTERRQGAGKAAAESAAALAAGQRRKVLVVFIGGVTYAEVGAGWRRLFRDGTVWHGIPVRPPCTLHAQLCI